MKNEQYKHEIIKNYHLHSMMNKLLFIKSESLKVNCENAAS